MIDKGDYSSNFTNEPCKHYTGVLKQQGRVDLDSHCNEAHDIAAYLRQTLTRDVIGSCGIPQTGGGFAIQPHVPILGVPKVTASDLEIVLLDLFISPGRAYVEGILCEMETTPVPIGKLLPDNGEIRRVEVPTLVVDCRELQEGQAVTIFADRRDPIDARITHVARAQRILTLDADISRFNIEGVPAPGLGLRRRITYTTQPDYNPPPLERFEFHPGNSVSISIQDNYLVYLDVWQRHVTAFEDPDILEVALGGPDTTTRVKTVCQVKVMKGVFGEFEEPITDCEAEIEGWPPSSSGGRLSAEVVPTPAAEDPCLIAPGGGYRGLENRFYMIEIHTPGNLGEAKFKVSRDNGSAVFPIEEFVSSRQLKLKSIAKDRVRALRVGDQVEVFDDHTVYHQHPSADGQIVGTMAKIEDVDELGLVTLNKDIPANTYSVDRHARVLRWDHKTQNADGLLTTAPGPITLEDGIQVRFSGDNFKVGDRWSFAARTATGDVERLVEAPPQGIKHHYCRLALIEANIRVDIDKDGNVDSDATFHVTDCRPIFLSLTEINQVLSEITPIGVSTVNLEQSVISAGNSTKGTVSLTGPAPPGGARVRLSSDDDIATVHPNILEVPEGQDRAEFAVDTELLDAPGEVVTVTITASFLGDTRVVSLRVVFQGP